MIENVHVLLVRDGSEYLLQYRDDKPAISDSDMYSTWGGRKETCDLSDRATALRELREETGIVCDEATLLDLGTGQFKDGSPDNRGRLAWVHYFALQIPRDTVVENTESDQGIARLQRPYRHHPKVNAVAREAITRYEAAT
jgi:8-oxo-dGTP pyrophosphatase MutT (NUDIX family)